MSTGSTGRKRNHRNLQKLGHHRRKSTGHASQTSRSKGELGRTWARVDGIDHGEKFTHSRRGSILRAFLFSSFLFSPLAKSDSPLSVPPRYDRFKRRLVRQEQLSLKDPFESSISFVRELYGFIRSTGGGYGMVGNVGRRHQDYLEELQRQVWVSTLYCTFSPHLDHAALSEAHLVIL